MAFNKYCLAFNSILLLVIGFVLSSPGVSRAEERKSGSFNPWVTAGIGFGKLAGETPSGSGIVGINLRYKKLFVGARGTFVGNLEILECNDFNYDKALLLGVATKIFGPYVLIGVGISEVHGHFCQDLRGRIDPGFEADVTSSGFPIDIQVLPKKRLGFAFRVFANINSTRDFAGFTVNLALGGLP